MPTDALKTAFSRFVTDYGMVFVLLALCACFSVATYKEQHPRDAAGGRQLAHDIAAEHGAVRVVILVEKDDEAADFAVALAERLSKDGSEVLETLVGGPQEWRGGLERLSESDRLPQVIACSAATSRKGVIRKLPKFIPVLADTPVAVPASYWGPDFLKASNLRAVANRMSVIAIIAIGMTLVIITAGIDLSVGSLIAFSAVTATLLIREVAGAREAGAIGMTLCCLAAIGLCALLGAFSGLMITAFRMPFFVVTLSMMQIARGLAYKFSDSQTIYQLPEGFTALGRGFVLGVPNTVALMLVLYVAAHVMMSRTVLGRYIYAVGGNREAARLSGVPVKRILLLCYVVCGALAGVGGVIRASELRSGAPTYGQMVELDVIAAVVVGGASLAGGEGKIFSTLIGALIIAVMRNGMNLINIESNTQTVVLGLVLLAAVLIDVIKKKGWSIFKPDG
ncbi:MAG: ABC transporter permease [Planctomycetes bacterium]|nr:ABC transporter permease [Planctomycetota bacterium]